MSFIFSWRKVVVRTVVVLCITISLSIVAIGWLVATESGARQVLSRVLPVINNIPDIRLELEYRSGTLYSGMQFSRLALALDSGRQQLQLTNAGFRWQPLSLLNKHVHIEQIRAEQVSWQAIPDNNSNAPSFGPEELKALLFNLPLSIQLDSLQVSSFTLQQDDLTLADQRVEVAALNLNSNTLSAAEVQWLWQASSVTTSLQLSADLSLNAGLSWKYELDPVFAGEAKLSGTLEQLEIVHELALPFGMRSGGQLITGFSSGAVPAVNLQHSAQNVDLALLGLAEYSLQNVNLDTVGALDNVAIRGNLDLQEPRLGVTNFTLDLAYIPAAITVKSIAASNAELNLTTVGQLTLAPLQVQLDVSLARLNLDERLPQLQLAGFSGNAVVDLQQTNTGWQGSVALGPMSGELQGFPLALDGLLQIQDDKLQDVNVDIASQANHLQVSGQLSPNLNLLWSLGSPQLGQLWDGLTGDIAGSGKLTGTLAEPVLEGSLQGSELGYSQDGNSVVLQALQLEAKYQSGTNALELDISGLSSSGNPGALPILDRATLVLSGNPAAHTLSIQGRRLDDSFDLTMQGSYLDSDWQGQVSKASVISQLGDWQLVQGVAIAINKGHLSMGQQCWGLDELSLCLVAQYNSATGLDADLSVKQFPLDWLNTKEPPLNKPAGLQDLQQAYALILPSGLVLDGSASISARISQYKAGTWNSLSINVHPENLVADLLRVNESELQTMAPEVQRFSFQDVTLALAHERQVWQLDTGFRVSHVSDGGADLQGILQSQIQMDATEMLNGSLALNFDDLAWVETFLPDIRNARGQLAGNILITGSRNEPLLSSDISLQQASFSIPELGINLDPVSAQLHSVDHQYSIGVSAVSGEGHLQFNADLLRPLQADRELQASLQGDDFLLVSNEAIEASVSPDIKLVFANNALDVRGKLAVPIASIDLEALIDEQSNSGVNVSRDAVVVVDDASANAGSQSQSLPLTANIALALGDSVRLKGFGLDARITGELTVEQEINRPLLSYGELTIPEGSYTIYNQQLTTENGSLLFYGNPANPVVDIRANRKTASAEVGIELSGTVSKLQSHLYSTPALPENEILALLVTGKSFSKVNQNDSDALISAIASFGIERGEGLTSMVGNKLGLDSVTISPGSNYRDSSLGLGKYITPRLLMRYQVGLFDRQAVLSLNYTLTEHLKLEVETGLSQSVDISYTIESD